jgi:hypothetical protein
MLQQCNSNYKDLTNHFESRVSERNMRTKLLVALIGCVLLAGAQGGKALGQELPGDYQEVLTILGKKGDYKEKVLKVNIPRSDLKVTVAGVQTPTAFGFGGWVAMTKGDGDADVATGDLVLLQDEVNPVMSALLEHGLEVTALHNHFFWENPRIFYMHVHGHGKATELARELKPALDLIGHVPPVSEAQPAGTATGTAGAVEVVEGKLAVENLEKIIGHKGDQTGPVIKFTIGRNDLNVREMGALINARMGLNTWAAFVGTDEKAAVAGDVAMLESEVNAVLKALRSHQLDVVAIHHHMFGTQPQIIFLHYWGVGPAARLAEGFKAALNELGREHGNAHSMNDETGSARK